MGASISKIFSGLIWGKKDIRILILGLDNAGKTTLLYRLKMGEVVTTIPTIGFNVESVKYGQLTFDVWDLGGQTSIRPYWRSYYANTAAVIFVVDSTDIERLEIAADELRSMLNEDELRDAALLVFANKQDQPGAQGAGEISEALKLGELRDRNWSIVACSCIDGKGINEGLAMAGGFDLKRPFRTWPLLRLFSPATNMLHLRNEHLPVYLVCTGDLFLRQTLSHQDQVVLDPSFDKTRRTSRG